MSVERFDAGQSAIRPIRWGLVSRPAPPVLTVRYEGSDRTFAAGNDVVIGRDLRADVRVAHPLISRNHLLVRFDQGRWLAIDNGSLNGLYVNNRRVP
ncbi:MAG: FHA domain-containing protein, partial [Mycobacterium sp.]